MSLGPKTSAWKAGMSAKVPPWMLVVKHVTPMKVLTRCGCGLATYAATICGSEA